MIDVVEVFVRYLDGRQQVVAIGEAVTIRDLPEPVALGAPPSAEQLPALAELRAEMLDDAQAFTMRGDQARAQYAENLAERLATIMGSSDEHG